MNASVFLTFDRFNARITEQYRQCRLKILYCLHLKWCRPDTPCNYGQSDCRGDLVCGVDNCGELLGGLPGSCCAKIVELTETKKFTAAIEVGTWAEWGPWARPRGGWGRHRGRVFWPAHCQGAQGPCMGDVEIEQAKLE